MICGLLQNSDSRFSQEKALASQKQSEQQRERTKPFSTWTQDKGPNERGIVSQRLITTSNCLIPSGTRKAFILLPFLCSLHTGKGQAAATLLQSGTPRRELAGQPQARSCYPCRQTRVLLELSLLQPGEVAPGSVRRGLSSSSRRESRLPRWVWQVCRPASALSF